jgi:hypothetical protein
VIDKELEEVAKCNHKVEVIKQLKDMKNRGEWEEDMPSFKEFKAESSEKQEIALPPSL